MTLQIETSRQAGDEGDIVVKLEGMLAGALTEELENLCATLNGNELTRLRMDLEWITYIDESGQELLRGMMRRGATIIRSNLYVDSLFGRVWISGEDEG